MQSVPSWAVAIGLTALLLLSFGAGWRLYGVVNKDRADTQSDPGHLAAASLGLVSLLVGFTLAMSFERYEDRRRLVVDEASAISSAWLLDHALDEPFRTHLDGLFRDYVRERRGFADVGMSDRALDAADARTLALQLRIWRETSAGLRQPGASSLATPVLQSTNLMFDIPAARRAALDEKVPALIVWTVVGSTALAAAVAGYGQAPGRRTHLFAISGLFVAMALATALIVELDAPRRDWIRVPQAPMERVAADILSAPPPDSAASPH